jgi:putative endonuclease
LPERRKSTQSVGLTGEALALKYLVKKRYKIVETRFRLFRGEIDIIARDGGTLVFVEVKMRTSDAYGRPEESVTPAKQAQIRKVALGYLLARRLGDADCRFDVISIRQKGSAEFALEHFENAF